MKVIKIFVGILFIVTIFCVLANLEFSGYIYHNDLLAKKYKIQGIDISHHQIRINWNLVDKKYKFVLMKATEGQDFLDTDFLYNWNKAQISGFKVGAYHFFTMSSSGEAQAKYYISKVPNISSSFPPIIDMELRKGYDKDEVIKQLKTAINILENHYKKRVIIYTDYKSYKYYLQNELTDNYLWIRDVRKYPSILENDRWIIWQYSNRGHVKGISGFTDKNVLRYDDINWYIQGLEIE